MFSTILTAVASGNILDNNAVVAAISAIVGAVLTWSSTRYGSKKNVESVYLDKITKYMENQDGEIESLNNKLSTANSAIDKKDTEIESLKNTNDDLSEEIVDLHDQLANKDKEIADLKKNKDTES